MSTTGTETAATPEDQLDAMFAALADPTRRAILARLAGGGDATLNDLAEPFHITLQAVSKHLKVLERSGLISRSRVAQSRPCRLEPEALGLAADWIEQHRQAWTERFDKLERHLRDIQHSGRPPIRTTHPERTLP